MPEGLGIPGPARYRKLTSAHESSLMQKLEPRMGPAMCSWEHQRVADTRDTRTSPRWALNFSTTEEKEMSGHKRALQPQTSKT